MVAADATTRQEGPTLVMSAHQSSSIYDVDHYGYEDAAPDIRREGEERRATRHRTSSCGFLPQRMPRRSSLKQGDGSVGRRRRASIQMGEEITVYLPGQDQPVRRRNSIKFCESVKVRNIETLDKLTDSPQDLWFQGDEYAKMRRNSWDLVSRVESGQTGIGSKKFCLRGLERLLDRETVARKREHAWNTVLTQQERQRDLGSYDEHFLANAYKCTTMESALVAASRGKQDEKAILSYVRSAHGYCRRLSC